MNAFNAHVAPTIGTLRVGKTGEGVGKSMGAAYTRSATRACSLPAVMARTQVLHVTYFHVFLN